MWNLEQIEKQIDQASSYNKSKSDKHGEVFTPATLINEMLDQLPTEVWSDKTKTFFDPCAGKGNFPIQIVKRLMLGLEDEIPDYYDRYKWIMENQMFMSELQPESCQFIKDIFNPNGDIKIRLYEGSTLEMPEDYFNNEI